MVWQLGAVPVFRVVGWRGAGSNRSSGGRGAGDGDQVGRQDPEADPALEPVGAMLRAAVESIGALEDADAALDAGPPAIAPPEPALALARPAGRGRRPGMREGDAVDPGRGGVAAHAGRRAAAVAGQQPRRAAKLALVAV